MISAFNADTLTNLSPREAITLTVQSMDPDGDSLTYKYFVTDLAKDPLTVTAPVFYSGLVQIESSDKKTFEVPKKRGFYRLYVSVSDPHGNVAVANVPLSVGSKKWLDTWVPEENTPYLSGGRPTEPSELNRPAELISFKN